MVFSYMLLQSGTDFCNVFLLLVNKYCVRVIVSKKKNIQLYFTGVVPVKADVLNL